MQTLLQDMRYGARMLLKRSTSDEKNDDLTWLSGGVAYFLLADCYERSGDTKQAIENYEKSLALNPRDWDVVDRLKSLRAKQNRGGQ